MMAEGEAKSADDAAADDAEVPEPQLWLPATEVGTTSSPHESTHPTLGTPSPRLSHIHQPYTFF